MGASGLDLPPGDATPCGSVAVLWIVEGGEWVGAGKPCRRANLRGPDGKTRSIHRTIGNNSSFGGNSLVESIGLLDASRVAELVVT